MAACRMLRSELKKQLELSAFGRNQVIYLAYFAENGSSPTSHRCKTCNREIAEHDEASASSRSQAETKRGDDLLVPLSSSPRTAQMQPQYSQQQSPYYPQQQPQFYPQQQQQYYPAAQPVYLSPGQSQLQYPPQYVPPTLAYAPPLGSPVMGAPLVMSPVYAQQVGSPSGFAASFTSIPANLSISGTYDMATEPYVRTAIWKIVILLALSTFYGVSFGVAVAQRGSAAFTGLIFPALLVVCAALIGYETTSITVQFSKTTREVNYSQWRLLTHLCGPTKRTISFSDLSGEVQVAPDAASKQCWCMSASQCQIAICSRTAQVPMFVQRVYPSQASHQSAAWQQYLANTCQ